MTVENINPWTGDNNYRYEYFNAEQIEDKLAASAKAYPVWSALSFAERAAYLNNVAAMLREHRERIASTMTAEMGKLRREALGEIEKSAGACEYYAKQAQSYMQDNDIATEASHSFVTYEPIGCVFAVMPWNFPIWQVFRFLAPGLMAGNVALLKHATNVPQCADLIAEMIRLAGIPKGVFAVLHINNQDAAQVIADPRVQAITLTGSERAGKSVASNAGHHLKKCVMELGGSDPFVVLDDADLDKAIPIAIASRFGNGGQTCIAAKRFILTPGIAKEFVARFVAAASKLVVGDPNLDETTLAPMVRPDARDELHRQVTASLAAGATLLIGGEKGSGVCDYPATILDHVVPGVPAYSEELFGPVASIIYAKDELDAIRIANDTAFGLAASIWTEDKAKGEALARKIQAGAVFVNALVRSDCRLPFGGTKTSGFGRELAEHGIHEFMNIKTVYVD
ncbi:MAG: NAD-dependent succinate-semialdehyde dehydrogenase [Arenimonas sp.]|nr:NAD-dependent succinate-semialdehyde dehydrogenase [Arenimonas sp.]